MKHFIISLLALSSFSTLKAMQSAAKPAEAKKVDAPAVIAEKAITLADKKTDAAAAPAAVVAVKKDAAPAISADTVASAPTVEGPKEATDSFSSMTASTFTAVVAVNDIEGQEINERLAKALADKEAYDNRQAALKTEAERRAASAPKKSSYCRISYSKK